MWGNRICSFLCLGAGGPSAKIEGKTKSGKASAGVGKVKAVKSRESISKPAWSDIPVTPPANLAAKKERVEQITAPPRRASREVPSRPGRFFCPIKPGGKPSFKTLVDMAETSYRATTTLPNMAGRVTAVRKVAGSNLVSDRF